MSATIGVGCSPQDAQLEDSFEGSEGWVLEGCSPPSAASPASEPAPEDAVSQILSLEVNVAQPIVSIDAGELEVVLSVVAPHGDSAARAPLRLVAVLDKSGSMGGEKLRLVVETMCFMLQHLTECDVVGFVEYGSEVSVLAPLTRCNAAGKARLEKCLRRMKAGSQTNLSGGLLRGIELHSQEAQATSPVCPLQRLRFGNTWKRILDAEESESCPGQKNENEWTAEVQFENAEDIALVQKLVFVLHRTFKQPLEEVHEAPFQITRKGWGTFVVKAHVHLVDGRVLDLEHELVFGQPESFKTVLLPLRSAPARFVPPERLSGPAVPADVPILDGRAPCSDGAVRSCFLFTDGLANVGITKHENLCEAASNALDELGHRRCTLSTFGFGADHSADLLRSLAKAGGGEYSYIEGEESIGEAFGTVLGGLLSTTHQNVRLSLELSPGVALSRAKTARAVESSHGSEGVTVLGVDLGDLFAEERRDILLALSLPAVPEGLQVLGVLRARGFSVAASRSEDVVPIELCVQRSAGVVEGNVSNPQVACHQNRYVATTALEAARAAGGRGELGAARRCLEAAAESLASSDLAVQGDPMTLDLITDIQECLDDFKHKESHRAVLNKMGSMSHGHERQRACGTKSSYNYCNAMSREMGKSAYEYTKKKG